GDGAVGVGDGAVGELLDLVEAVPGGAPGFTRGRGQGAGGGGAVQPPVVPGDGGGGQGLAEVRAVSLPQQGGLSGHGEPNFFGDFGVQGFGDRVVGVSHVSGHGGDADGPPAALDHQQSVLLVDNQDADGRAAAAGHGGSPLRSGVGQRVMCPVVVARWTSTPGAAGRVMFPVVVRAVTRVVVGPGV